MSAEESGQLEAQRAAARRDPTWIDFHGTVKIHLKYPTVGGHHQLVLTAGTIDWQVEELLGGHQCHRFAAALNHLTEFDIVTIDIHDGTAWRPTHSAVLVPTVAPTRTTATTVGGKPKPDTLPNRKIIDIHGVTDLTSAEERYLKLTNGNKARHRRIDAALMPGDVLTSIDDLRGNHLWWTAEGPIHLVAVLMHYSRLVLRANGYGHHITEHS